MYFIPPLTIFRFQELGNVSKIFPTKEDYKNVCATISLIQENYDLNTTDLAEGRILMKNVSFILSKSYISIMSNAYGTFEIGQWAYSIQLTMLDQVKNQIGLFGLDFYNII